MLKLHVTSTPEQNACFTKVSSNGKIVVFCDYTPVVSPVNCLSRVNQRFAALRGLQHKAFLMQRPAQQSLGAPSSQSLSCSKSAAWPLPALSLQGGHAGAAVVVCEHAADDDMPSPLQCHFNRQSHALLVP